MSFPRRNTLKPNPWYDAIVRTALPATVLAWAGGCCDKPEAPSPEVAPAVSRPVAAPRGGATTVVARPTGETAAYRTGTPDPRAVAVPADLQKGVLREPQRYLAKLVQHLIQGQTTDLGRAKALHDWIALNIRYDVEGFLSGALPSGRWEDTLQKGQSVCEGYASLFERMCSLAELTCAKVSGYARGYGYDPFAPTEDSKSNHAWNAVQANGSWYLIDPTWDSGHIRGRAWVAEYGTDYLFLDPLAFLHTHLPTESKWQLLTPARTREEFGQLPFIRGGFFASGLILRTPVRRFSPADGSAAVEIDVPAGLTVSAQVAKAGGDPIDGCSFAQKEGAGTQLLARFPSAGDYLLRVFVAQPGAKVGWEAAELAFRSRSGVSDRFPKVFSTFDEKQCHLYAPMT